MKPKLRPKRPSFSSGPCIKPPQWSLTTLQDAFLGRSHRASQGKARLKEAIDLSDALLGLPDDYRLAIVPASDTGAMELALWSLLGTRGVDVLAWESFSAGWADDIQTQLKLTDVRCFEADYGELPDLSQVDSDRDVVFVWNGTTSGVRVPNAEWISDKRQGLTLCDATSAVFAMEIPWAKIDVATYSWQKSLGGEAAHGMLILSPRAIARLETYTPSWPLPKIFRLADKGQLDAAIFKGSTLNTPSMLCVEDALIGLKWAQREGGLNALIARTERNFQTLANWVEGSDWITFLAEQPEIRSPTSVCLKIVDPWFASQDSTRQSTLIKSLCGVLEDEAVAYDIANYRDAPPGLRIWCGPTVEVADIEALCPWLDWAYIETKTQEL